MLQADMQLMQAFNFTQEDILANRQGELTRHQKTKLITTKLFFGIMFSLVGAPGVFLVLDSRGNTNTSNIGFVFIIVGLLVGFGAIQLFDWIGVSAVRCTSGKATFKSKKGGLYLCIQRSAFLVKPEVKSLFTPDQQYDVYYSASFGILFSIETVKHYHN